jgi:hypothetical protein
MSHPHYGWCLLSLLLAGALGCQTPWTAPTETNGPRPLPPTPAPREGRMLLQTGAIQLGPGVGHNLWGWQGDGMSGL